MPGISRWNGTAMSRDQQSLQSGSSKGSFFNASQGKVNQQNRVDGVFLPRSKMH